MTRHPSQQPSQPSLFPEPEIDPGVASAITPVEPSAEGHEVAEQAVLDIEIPEERIATRSLKTYKERPSRSLETYRQRAARHLPGVRAIQAATAEKIKAKEK